MTDKTPAKADQETSDSPIRIDEKLTGEIPIPDGGVSVEPFTAAPANSKRVTKTDAPLVGYVKPAKVGILTGPCLFTKGDAPKVGAKIKFKTNDGKQCTGTVAHVTEINGETRVGFKDGIRRA